ncbi:hypothetical protein THTE_3548 [Thermogutta terrifontis]|uniref:Uncharacterized protein n=1 Tax=Thermogutta terrifontis TaxID=1331910 RepID=A0A286RJK4_9BACT|nr:hypothetical protein THTE_3548 [Thermogutta terrifontis]
MFLSPRASPLFSTVRILASLSEKIRRSQSQPRLIHTPFCMDLRERQRLDVSWGQFMSPPMFLQELNLADKDRSANWIVQGRKMDLIGRSLRAHANPWGRPRSHRLRKSRDGSAGGLLDKRIVFTHNPA